ncbi:parafibromin-like [Paramacrobiotus metropolitanus]|uniref:parafibromin-like n=1 Tax=Paramacrobiotus metropolitanus TaxID=2943436 RepID=UPI0024458105|nr:parafibromin-like [Paramacrobiotus metropolitanus]
MADPLSILRDFHINKKRIVERDDLIIFNDTAFKKNAKTNYLQYGSEKDSINKEYYTLDCLVFFLENEKVNHPAYVIAATNRNLTVVKRPDRKELLEYLSGEAATSERIDRYAPIELHVPFKRTAEEAPQQARRPRVETEKSIRDREKLQARLEAPRDQTATVSTEKLTSLSDMISVEKIAAIKAKRLTNKRNTIRTTDDDMIATSDLQPVMDADVDALREVVIRERVGRTRADITRGPKNLTERLAPIFAMIKNKDERKKTDAAKVVPTVKPSIPAPKPAVAPVSYNRYEQEQLNKASGLEFNINTMQSYRAAQDAKAADGSPEKMSGKTQTDGGTGQRKTPSKTPIIVVPSAPTSLITMYNCMDILQDNKFVPSDTKKKDGTKYESEMLIQRKKPDGTTVSIRVMDNPSKLSMEDWDRVVAVFVQGPAWQFKGWPWSGNPVDIFERLKAFHLKFDEMPTDKNVAGWNVQVVPINRTKRHLDRASLLKFWESLDKFVVKNRPHLRW